MTVLCDADNHDDEKINAYLLQYSNLFKVMLDFCITTNSIIVLSITEVDESIMINEFLPVKKLLSSFIIADSLNSSDVIIVYLMHLLNDNTISIIAIIIDEAKFFKLKT